MPCGFLALFEVDLRLPIDKNISIVDDFIAERRQEYLIEEKRKYAPVIITADVL
ncbi:hypothetical protein [Rickettsia endosymbiont of Cantharis rufa]|uniref:hypothetical protein n=1 Tax=Rickettsia endosymbiont of Cantharis rufa TaxID=3066248 RepID=UPI00313320DC